MTWRKRDPELHTGPRACAACGETAFFAATIEIGPVSNTTSFDLLFCPQHIEKAADWMRRRGVKVL